MDHVRIARLLKDYSMEDLLEAAGLDPVEAIELLITYGALTLEDIVEGVD